MSSKRYYFPNTVVKHEDAVIEIASGGTVYQRDERGSLRRIPSVWLGQQQMLTIELLDGRKVSLKMIDGKVIARNLINDKEVIPVETMG